MKIRNKLKKVLKRIYYFFKDNNFMELVLVDFLLIGGLLAGSIGYLAGFILYLGIVILKILKRNLKESIFTYNLFEASSDNYRFLILAIINIIMILSFALLNYKIFETFVVLFIYRLIFKGENYYVQNYILRTVIEDLYNWGEVLAISKLCDEKTKRSLNLLFAIKKDVKSSMDEKIKTDLLKAELITNISHDLKTPLTSIINYSDILARKDKLDEEAKEYISILNRNSTRLRSLIIDLIYASKTSSGNIRIEKSFLDFNELVLQIYGDFDAGLKKKKLDFIYNYDEEYINIYSDGNILSRIIENLISNAYKYSKEDSVIKASTKSRAEEIEFEIRNYFLGQIDFDPDELLKELVKNEKARNSKGSGLGLVITKNLIEILGGQLKILLDQDQFIVRVTLKRDISD
ncbi:MAG: sensor histidine kinase [Peptoniphilaceae bacterium]